MSSVSRVLRGTCVPCALARPRVAGARASTPVQLPVRGHVPPGPRTDSAASTARTIARVTMSAPAARISFSARGLAASSGRVPVASGEDRVPVVEEVHRTDGARDAVVRGARELVRLGAGEPASVATTASVVFIGGACPAASSLLRAIRSCAAACVSGEGYGYGCECGWGPPSRASARSGAKNRP